MPDTEPKPPFKTTNYPNTWQTTLPGSHITANQQYGCCGSFFMYVSHYYTKTYAIATGKDPKKTLEEFETELRKFLLFLKPGKGIGSLILTQTENEAYQDVLEKVGFKMVMGDVRNPNSGNNLFMYAIDMTKYKHFDEPEPLKKSAIRKTPTRK